LFSASSTTVTLGAVVASASLGITPTLFADLAVHSFASVIVIVLMVVTVELMKVKLLCVTNTVDVDVATPLFSFTVIDTVCRMICVVVANAGAVRVVVTYTVAVTATLPPVGRAVVDTPEPPLLPHLPKAA
jgi:hypothetical protein